MFGGVFVIFLILCYILFGLPVLKYYRDHQATPQRGMYMENGEQYISGYSIIENALQSHGYRNRVWVNYKNSRVIYPVDKAEFFSENPDAQREYLQAMVRAMSWDIGYIPINKHNVSICNVFKNYNDKYKSAEMAYYTCNKSKYRNKEVISEYENDMLKKKNNVFTLKYYDYEFDIRSYWDLDPLRYSF